MFARKNKSSNRTNNTSKLAASTASVIETLESREMYSASPLAISTAHITHSTALAMTLNAGSNSESIYLMQSGSTVAVEINGVTKTYANIGSVTVNGNSGNDEIVICRSVTDKVTVFADSGNDLIVSGANNDVLVAGTGHTNLVAFGGRGNSLVAGSGYTNIWATAGNTYTRGKGTLVLHAVNGLMNTSDMTLDGATFAEPATNTQTQDTGGWTNISSLPLYSVNGPTMNDISQGELGTCYFLSSLGSIAMQNPQHIHNLITPLGDGTYLEQFVHAGKAYFVRIDGYVPYTKNAQNLEFAHLGTGNSTWVPLLEKGWAYFHAAEVGSAPSYGAVEGGLGGVTLTALGGTGTVSISNMGQTFYDGQDMLSWIDQQLSEGHAVNMGFQQDIAGQTYGHHEYSAVEVVYNNDGSIAGIWVHNPWGVDLNSGIAAYGHNDGYNDGYVFITADTAFGNTNDMASAAV